MVLKLYTTKENDNVWASLTDLIKADVDWSDVSGADGRHGEEAVFPVTNVHSTLVEVKHALQPASYTWIDAE